MSQNISWYWRGYIWCWLMIPVNLNWQFLDMYLLLLHVQLTLISLLNAFLFLNTVCSNALRSPSIYMNWCKIKHSGPLFKYSHTKTHYMLMYINIHKKSPAPWYCWRRPVMALSSKFNKKCPTCLVELTN